MTTSPGSHLGIRRAPIVALTSTSIHTADVWTQPVELLFPRWLEFAKAIARQSLQAA